MNTYPWPTSLGPIPVAVVDNRLVYGEPRRRRFCDDGAVIDHYLRSGQYEAAGRLMAAARGLGSGEPA